MHTKLAGDSNTDAPRSRASAGARYNRRLMSLPTATEPADWDALVEELAAQLRSRFVAGRPWRDFANAELAPAALDRRGTAEGFLAWAKGHRMWSLTVAECAREVCGKPREAAIYVLCAIVEEVLEDEQDEAGQS